MLQNLWKVTDEFLSANGKTWNDIRQVQAVASGCVFDLAKVQDLMKKTLFDPQAPGDEVASDLVLVGDDWGARWSSGWVFMYIPKTLEPKEAGACPTVLSCRDIPVDAAGYRSPVYGLSVAEMNPVPEA